MKKIKKYATKKQLKQYIINSLGDDDGVVYLDISERFFDLFLNKEYTCVSVYDTTLYSDDSVDIIGICCEFALSCNEIIPISGNTYNDNGWWMDVVAYQEWEDPCNKKRLDIYVKGW